MPKGACRPMGKRNFKKAAMGDPERRRGRRKSFSEREEEPVEASHSVGFVGRIRSLLGDRITDRREARAWTFLMPKEAKPAIWAVPDNPCIPYMRKIVESLLARKGCGYREFYPLVLDFEEDEVKRGIMESSFQDYETEREILRLRRQVDNVLWQLTPGLNRMVIRTSRPAYFEEFVQTMYEENGLVIQLEEKSFEPFPKDCFVMDFELWGEPAQRMFREDIFYLPIYRKPWEIAENLDILVPIGYNTVIVKGAVTTSGLSADDWMENEFYRK